MSKMPMVDFADLESIQGQIGSAVLDLRGKLVRVGGQMTAENASILFDMLVEVGMLKEQGDFERMVVSLEGCDYSVVRDSSHVYVVKTKPL
jgi:hypothetical protein